MAGVRVVEAANAVRGADRAHPAARPAAELAHLLRRLQQAARAQRASSASARPCSRRALLVLTAPLAALTALLVRLSSPGPVLYRQTRVGLDGQTFDLLKWRTMRADAETDVGAGLGDRRRTTRASRGVGRFMRKTRLDELPQLWNVLRGDMSFVGPRPERPHFVEQLREVIPFYDERHSVRPGHHGLGPGQVPLRLDARGRGGEARVRPLLRQAHVAAARRGDRARDGQGDAARARALSGEARAGGTSRSYCPTATAATSDTGTTPRSEDGRVTARPLSYTPRGRL